MAVWIKSSNVLVGGRFAPAEILVEQGRIVAVGKTVCRPAGCQAVDLGEKTVMPGLIDTHIHGFAGWDTMDCTEEALMSIARALPKAGVTSFYPTTMTASRENIQSALRCVAKVMGKPTGGARVLGAFLEGPFISAEHRGAQPLESIVPIDLPWVEKLCAAYPGALKKMILAPELPGAAEAVAFFKEKGIVAALGHSSATYNQAKGCVEAGASVAVHTYNGMSSLHHREPGMAGAAMHLNQLYAELICDGIHVHPAAMEVLLRCKGPEKLMLISDCMRAGGMEDGEYMLGDTKTVVKNGIACTESGALAGSTLRLIDGVKNAVSLLGLPLEQAAAMASQVPAMAMGIYGETGSIAPGKWADIIAIDGEYQVEFAMVNGKSFL